MTFNFFVLLSSVSSLPRSRWEAPPLSVLTRPPWQCSLLLRPEVTPAPRLPRALAEYVAASVAESCVQGKRVLPAHGGPACPTLLLWQSRRRAEPSAVSPTVTDCPSERHFTPPCQTPHYPETWNKQVENKRKFQITLDRIMRRKLALRSFMPRPSLGRGTPGRLGSH